MLIMGCFYLGITVLVVYIDPNGIKNKNILEYPYLTNIQKCELLIEDIRMVYKCMKLVHISFDWIGIYLYA